MPFNLRQVIPSEMSPALRSNAETEQELPKERKRR